MLRVVVVIFKEVGRFQYDPLALVLGIVLQCAQSYEERMSNALMTPWKTLNQNGTKMGSK